MTKKWYSMARDDWMFVRASLDASVHRKIMVNGKVTILHTKWVQEKLLKHDFLMMNNRRKYSWLDYDRVTRYY